MVAAGIAVVELTEHIPDDETLKGLSDIVHSAPDALGTAANLDWGSLSDL